MKALSLIAVLVFTLSACSDAAKTKKSIAGDSEPSSFEASAPALENCRFKTSSVTYSLNANIEPNAVVCDVGYIQKAQIISPVNLPAGLQFSSSSIALIGAPSEKLATTTFKVYLENSAGYVIIPLQITVQ